MGPSTIAFALSALAACGQTRKTDSEDCAVGQHWADPDGRGGRCVSDGSACDEPRDCPDTDDPCCVSSCVDANGSGVFSCVERCDTPSCTGDDCGADQRCQVIDDCSAYCVPDDVECEDGTVPADPSGTGTFVCVDDESECFDPADCAGVVVDQCCTTACVDGGGGRYECQESCDDVARPAGEGDVGVACMCTTNADCIAQNGQGWRCVQGGGCFGGCYCEIDPACTCDAQYRPVCGVDGQTYDSGCGEACVPVEVACQGECPCADDCDCLAGAYVPVCGVDGQTYDATCGDSCVPVAIACRGECPCACAAQQAVSDGGACDAWFGWFWDGARCGGFSGCDCVGADCAAAYDSEDACLAAHAGC